MGQHTGEFAALITAFLWTITALSFEQASKQVGSLAVNLIRLVLAFILYSIFLWIRDGQPFDPSISKDGKLWLAVSGLVGFVLGDYCLFKAYILIGSRVSNLLMALAPPLAAFFGFMVINETLALLGLIGMLITLSGIVLVILRKPGKKFTLQYSKNGVLYGLGAAAGQAVGLVFSKLGMGDADPFAASQIRVIAGIGGYLLLFTVLNRWKKLIPAFTSLRNFGFIAVGSFFGPFLGVSFSLMAVKFTTTGIASTIMAIVPVLIIAPSVWIFKEKIGWRDLLGAVIAVSGVALFFIF